MCSLCGEDKPKTEFIGSNDNITWVRERCSPCYKLAKNLFHTDDGQKLCRKCSTLKSLDQFGNDKKKADKLRTHCKSCNSKAYKDWYYSDVDNSRAVSQNWRDTNKQKRKEIWQDYYLQDKASKLKKNYGIEYEDYLLMLEDQNFKCLTCNSDFSKMASRKIHLDHNHSTGEIRGILCHNCNIALGLLKEDIAVLKRMILYIDGEL